MVASTFLALTALAATMLATTTASATGNLPSPFVTLRKRDCDTGSTIFATLNGAIADEYIVAKAGPAVQVGGTECECAAACQAAGASCAFYVWHVTEGCFLKPLNDPSGPVVTVYKDSPSLHLKGDIKESDDNNIVLGTPGITIPVPNANTIQACVEFCNSLSIEMCSVVTFDRDTKRCYPKRMDTSARFGVGAKTGFRLQILKNDVDLSGFVNPPIVGGSGGNGSSSNSNSSSLGSNKNIPIAAGIGAGGAMLGLLLGYCFAARKVDKQKRKGGRK